MSSIKIGFPDGNGLPGGYSFWKEYCVAARLELINVSEDLYELQNLCRSNFPVNICLASKYRLGRAILLDSLVDYLVFFLHNDEFVYNCPNSVYRIKWIKAYLERIGSSTQIITWPFDFSNTSDLHTNILRLTEHVGGDLTKVKEFISHYEVLPDREPVYKLEYDKRLKNILLIGKIPFILDPYRRTALMDILTSNYGVLMPHILMDNDTSLLDKKGCNVIFYKEKSIKAAIDIAISKFNIHCVILAADVFDIPGNYTFPILKQYLRKMDIPYIHLKVTLRNVDALVNTIIDKIENINKCN